MKKIIKKVLGLALIITMLGCESDDIVFGNTQFMQVSNSNAVSVVENGGQTVEVQVVLGAPQSQDVAVEWDVEGDASRFTITPNGGSVSIPAGETSVSVFFTAIDNDTIDGDEIVTLSLSSSSGLPVGIGGGDNPNGKSKVITIIDDNVPCNDYTLEITTDQYANETYWYIVNNDTNERVLEGGGLSDGVGQVITEQITLDNGCYTFTIWDEYGDGMVSSQGDGSYILTCGSLTAAQGSGVFDSIGFPGVTNADLPVGFQFQQQPTADLVGFVETIEFCVNQ